MSTQSRPRRAPSSTPAGPRYAASTCEDEGSIVTTRSLCLAASAAEPAAAAPRVTAASSAARITSKATTANPFASRFLTIGCPMVPVPMNPIFMMLSVGAGTARPA